MPMKTTHVALDVRRDWAEHTWPFKKWHVGTKSGHLHWSVAVGDAMDIWNGFQSWVLADDYELIKYPYKRPAERGDLVMADHLVEDFLARKDLFSYMSGEAVFMGGQHLIDWENHKPQDAKWVRQQLNILKWSDVPGVCVSEYSCASREDWEVALLYAATTGCDKIALHGWQACTPFEVVRMKRMREIILGKGIELAEICLDGNERKYVTTHVPRLQAR